MRRERQQRTARKRREQRDKTPLVLHLLREFPNKKFSIRHIAASTGGASKAARDEIMDIVTSLCGEGLVEDCGRGKYRIGRGRMPRCEGVVRMLPRSGSLLVRVDESGEEVYVRTENGGGAVDGDRVEVVVVCRRSDGGCEGEIVRVVERGMRRFVGVAEVNEHRILVRTEAHHGPGGIYLSKRHCPEVADGDKVVVQVVGWSPEYRYPSGRLVEILGRHGDNETEMHAILTEYGLPYRFDAAVEEAAAAIPAAIPEAEIARRRDFRDVATFTIDPADAKDFDDALSIRRVEEQLWEVGIHIADVTHYVGPGTKLDREAEARGTSVYLVDRTVPMLPERLSNDLCSLRPGVERLCFSAVFRLDARGELHDEWFGRTVIRSDRRFTYGEAQQVIETGTGDFAGELQLLHGMAQQLRARRMQAGALSIDRPEMKFRLDAQGRPLEIYMKEQKEANRLIEEFMLLANRRVAEFCGRRRSPQGRVTARTMIYRIHDEPSEEKMMRFRQFVQRMGQQFHAAQGRAVTREINRILDQTHQTPAANGVAMMAMRAMAKACYSTCNIGHYGLAFDYYTHFTSPIRRYPDMLAHRLLARYLEGRRSAERESLESRCQYASEREQLAAEAERASIRYKMVEFMKDRVGQTFTARITGLNAWGVYVELDENHVDGSVSLADMLDDRYQYDDRRFEMVGRTNRFRLALGDAVRVRLKAADLEQRQLDFELWHIK